MKPILTILFLFSVLSGRANDYFDITNSTILSVSNGSAMTATITFPSPYVTTNIYAITNDYDGAWSGFMVRRTETNWVSIGTFTDKSGNSFDVEEGTRVTNTVVVIDYKGKTHELILETATGQKCGEHKVPKPPPPPTMWWTPLTNNTIMMTNVYIGTGMKSK